MFVAADTHSHAASDRGAFIRHVIRQGRFIGFDVEGFKRYAVSNQLLDGSYFVDRNSDMFPVILDFMRSGVIPEGWDEAHLTRMKVEAEFYQVPALVTLIVGLIKHRKLNVGMTPTEVEQLKAEHLKKLTAVTDSTTSALRQVQTSTEKTIADLEEDIAKLKDEHDDQRCEVKRAREETKDAMVAAAEAEAKKNEVTITFPQGCQTNPEWFQNDDSGDQGAGVEDGAVLAPAAEVPPAEPRYLVPPGAPTKKPLKTPQLLTAIHEVIEDALMSAQEDAEKGVVKRAPLTAADRDEFRGFLFDHFLVRRGSPAATKEYMRGVQDGIVKLSSKSVRIDVFGTMLGLCQPEMHSPMFARSVIEIVGNLHGDEAKKTPAETLALLESASFAVARADAVRALTQCSLNAQFPALVAALAAQINGAESPDIEVDELLSLVLSASVQVSKLQLESLDAFFQAQINKPTSPVDLGDWKKLIAQCCGARFSEREQTALFRQIIDETSDDIGGSWTLSAQEFARFCYGMCIYAPGIDITIKL
jgi:hypothetical protein